MMLGNIPLDFSKSNRLPIRSRAKEKIITNTYQPTFNNKRNFQYCFLDITPYGLMNNLIKLIIQKFQKIAWEIDDARLRWYTKYQSFNAL